MRNPGNGSKEEIISRFGKYVSSGKADFFKSVGIDFVFRPQRRSVHMGCNLRETSHQLSL